jgi:hypothetical protein
MSRSRYTGSNADVVKILVSSMQTPDSLAYSENLNAPKVPAKIVKHKRMWSGIVKLNESLTFTQKFMEEAFEKAGEEAGATKWARKLNEKEMATWKKSMAKRFRAMARHITQSMAAKWCKTMFDGGETTGDDAKQSEVAESEKVDADGEANEGEEEEEEEAEGGGGDDEVVDAEGGGGDDEEIDAFIYKYDNEVGNTYRVRAEHADDKKAIKEWGSMVTQEGKPFPFAQFGGKMVEITSITSEAWTEQKHGKNKGPRPNLLWEGTKGDDNISVVKKKDHSLLVCMFSKTDGAKQRMLCMMSVKSWGPEDSALL